MDQVQDSEPAAGDQESTAPKTIRQEPPEETPGPTGAVGLGFRPRLELSHATTCLFITLH